MATKKLTLENFEEEIINSNKPVLIDFYADWCGPCQMMAPLFENLSEEFKDKVSFLKLDTQAEEGIAMRFQVQGIPSLVFMKEGKEIDRFVGFSSEEDLRQKIETALQKIN